MKKLFQILALLGCFTALADEGIDFQRLYWQIGNGYDADKADAGRFYATIGEGDKIYLGGYKKTTGAATGVEKESDLVYGGTAFAANYQAALYYFELVNSADGLVLSTSQGFTYWQLLAAGAFDIDYSSLTEPSVTHAGVFTAYTLIPEPTSALLLLVGLAGLSLRRRRA